MASSSGENWEKQSNWYNRTPSVAVPLRACLLFWALAASRLKQPCHSGGERWKPAVVNYFYSLVQTTVFRESGYWDVMSAVYMGYFGVKV